MLIENIHDALVLKIKMSLTLLEKNFLRTSPFNNNRVFFVKSFLHQYLENYLIKV
jgi:hypothetical protein